MGQQDGYRYIYKNIIMRCTKYRIFAYHSISLDVLYAGFEICIRGRVVVRDHSSDILLAASEQRYVMTLLNELASQIQTNESRSSCSIIPIMIVSRGTNLLRVSFELPTDPSRGPSWAWPRTSQKQQIDGSCSIRPTHAIFFISYLY